MFKKIISYAKSVFVPANGFFHRSRLRTKMLLSYLFAVFLPIMLIGYFFINRSTEVTLTYTDSINKMNFNQIKNNFDKEFEKYILTANNISLDNQLLRYLNNHYSTDADAGEKYLNFNNMYLDYKTKLSYIELSGEKLSVFTNNNGVRTGGGFIYYLSEPFRNTEWASDIIEKGRGYVISAPFIGATNVPVIPLVMLLPFEDTTYTNFLRLDIPETTLFRLINQESKSNDIYVLNSQNYIITSTRRDLVGKKISSIPDINDSIDSILFQKKIQVSSGTVVYGDTIGKAGTGPELKIINVVSSAAMMDQVYSNIRKSILLCFLNFVLMAFVVLHFSDRFTSRLLLLADNMSHIQNEEGRFEVVADCTGNDEIAEISISFKNMIERINILIKEVYEADLHIKELEIQKRVAELHALYSQINPHFIFNTMESIRMNLLKKGELEISEIIQSFSRLLRLSINWSEDNIPLRQEFELVESYLKIQKFRFKDRLSYELSLPQELENCLIPKFTLQPLVENSIHHGLEPKESSGFLKIEARPEGDNLVITIKDNGIGMDKTQIDRINASLQSDAPDDNSSDSIGLMNVHKRICLSFGKPYGISILSIQDMGTVVTAIFPQS